MIDHSTCISPPWPARPALKTDFKDAVAFPTARVLAPTVRVSKSGYIRELSREIGAES